MLISTQTGHSVGRLGFEQGVLTLKNAGYDCLDLSLFEMIRDDSPYIAGDWRKLVEERKAFCDANGIIFNQSHAPFSFAWADENIRENIAKPRVEQSLEISAMMGVKIAVVHPLHWMPYLGHEDEINELNIQYYKSLVPLARNLGVKIALENMWQKEIKRKCICTDVAGFAKDHAALIDAIDSEWVVACLDVGHCSLVGEEAEDTIRILGHDRLKSVHLHDNDYQGDRHTIPGLGLMNWDNIMKAFEDIKYDGEFTYEADAFLKGFDNEFFPTAVEFMVKRAKHLVSKTSL
ncbi:MAG: sugar phosphate isomerase/epimerase [Clostridia bacterium]|nr:sugar phosphate isomerase/epimerase [Clostridia bacterium]